MMPGVARIIAVQKPHTVIKLANLGYRPARRNNPTNQVPYSLTRGRVMVSTDEGTSGFKEGIANDVESIFRTGFGSEYLWRIRHL